MAGKFLNWTPALAWMGLIFYLSSKTGPSGPEWWSIVAHVVEYGVLAGLLYLALSRTTGLSPAGIVTQAVVLATLYGATDEWHQALVPGRVPDPMDLLTDFLAAAAAAIMIDTVRKKRA